MERDLDQDEFEIFLKQKADQFKLYPSERSWKTIFTSLHPGMKWFKIGGTSLLLSTLFFIYHETIVVKSPTSSSSSPAPSSINHNLQVPEAKAGNDISFLPQAQTLQAQTISPVIKAGTNQLAISKAQISVPTAIAVNTNSSDIVHPYTNSSVQSFVLSNNKPLDLTVTPRVSIPVATTLPIKEDEQVATLSKSSNSEDAESVPATVNGIAPEAKETGKVSDFNWLQEMAAIRLTAQKKSKFNLQFYFSPTVSYRRLTDNQNTSHSTILNTVSIPRDLNINRYVEQTPAIGAELGSNMLFAVNRNLTVKSGLQLNYSRYNIKAYKFYYEKASIALNSTGAVADTISSYTSLRNFSGYAPEDLQNQYLQISVPVGAELKILGNKRLQFSVAGTIQPTLLLFSDTYLLSTNYMNYTKEPSLVRKWNLHSSVEAFLSYKTGGLRWQLGPQFRYQLMSSFNDRYPIKEYIWEYGVKIGVSKTLR